MKEVLAVSTLTVRNLDPEVKNALSARAVQNGRSMEGEARAILTTAVNMPTEAENRGLGSRIRARFTELEWDGPSRSDDTPRAAELGA